MVEAMSKHNYRLRYRRFCDLLAEARSSAGLTQTELASRLGKPQSYVSKYERAERRIDFVELLDIAETLGIEITTFLAKLEPSEE